MKRILLICICGFYMSSCVPKKDYERVEWLYEDLLEEYARLSREHYELQQEYEWLEELSENIIEQINNDVNSRLEDLNGELRTLREDNRNLRCSLWTIQNYIRYGKLRDALKIIDDNL